MNFSSSITFFILWLAKLTPIRARSSLGSTLGRLASLIPSKDVKIGKLQAIRAGFDPKVIHKSYAHFGKITFESLNATSVLNNFEQHFLFSEGASYLPELKQPEHGAVVLTGHYGHWDLLAGFGIKLGVPIVAIGRPARGEIFQHLLEKLREMYGIRTLWRGGAKGVEEIESELKNRSVVAALIDQDTKVRSIMVPFLGIEAATPSTLITIALKNKIPIYSAFVRCSGYLKYSVSVQKIIDATNEKEVLTQYNAHLEKLIREDPSQWVWFHKRWRTQPDGKRLSSSEYLHLLSTCRLSTTESSSKS